MSTVRARVLLALIAAALLVSPVPAVYAQVRITGAITGTVKDSTDAVVPGASVVLKDEATNATHETVTGSSGLFSFPDLNHGHMSGSPKCGVFHFVSPRSCRQGRRCTERGGGVV
jgi:hypothetical protein